LGRKSTKSRRVEGVGGGKNLKNCDAKEERRENNIKYFLIKSIFLF